MADKSNFTPDEWKALLQGVIAAGIAITAAEPSGLWGLLKEGFAGGAVMAKAKTNSSTNGLIKAAVDDFGAAEGSAARDGLKARFKQSKPAEIKEAASRPCDRLRRSLTPKRPAMLRLIRLGCSKSASTLLKPPRKVDFSASAACRSVTPRRQRSPKSQVRSRPHKRTRSTQSKRRPAAA